MKRQVASPIYSVTPNGQGIILQINEARCHRHRASKKILVDSHGGLRLLDAKNVAVIVQAYLSSSNSTATNFLPSSISRLAPPPVLT